jgi:hypothetical protein
MIRVGIPQKNFDENLPLEPTSRRDQDLELGDKSLSLLSVHKFYRSKN